MPICAVIIGIMADRLYFLELDKKTGHHRPNRWSWLIWCLTSYVEVATFKGISADWLKVIPLATTPIACTILFWKVWKMREDKWESRLDRLIDICSVTASISAIVIWVCFQEKLWAHIIMIVAVPVSYIPTWRSIPKETHSGWERSWMLWTIMDALNLVLNIHRLNSLAELPYVTTELICHGSVWFLISRRST